MKKKQKLHVDQAAEYSIRVSGYLEESWSDRLSGMAILQEMEGNPGNPSVTTLIGPLIDQAALFGVLNSLYDMRLPLLSVECLSSVAKNG